MTLHLSTSKNKLDYLVEIFNKTNVRYFVSDADKKAGIFLPFLLQLRHESLSIQQIFCIRERKANTENQIDI